MNTYMSGVSYQASSMLRWRAGPCLSSYMERLELSRQIRAIIRTVRSERRFEMEAFTCRLELHMHDRDSRGLEEPLSMAESTLGRRVKLERPFARADAQYALSLVDCLWNYSKGDGNRVCCVALEAACLRQHPPSPSELARSASNDFLRPVRVVRDPNPIAAYSAYSLLAIH